MVSGAGLNRGRGIFDSERKSGSGRQIANSAASLLWMSVTPCQPDGILETLRQIIALSGNKDGVDLDAETEGERSGVEQHDIDASDSQNRLLSRVKFDSGTNPGGKTAPSIESDQASS